MISIGIDAAKSSMRSTWPLSAIASSSPSTSVSSPGSIAAMWRCDSAPRISRRTRVCSGGSLNTRLVVWCSSSGDGPYFGPNSFFLSELKTFGSR